ncbi:hypothetical protein [Limnofasciculus baicalensis]|uniref:Uncharacterized protein n=1 Tax=Limnofasciculus baicalensis BBK-W-15 TaxID=2699891 RepID=A0AAE3KSY2_9CYAN|nr:hypothetical protein [Limnofasciculus baicalensis]MCP2729947.1 hypothetical protein [Limnofasciculus baicalensis BBK-W-15]
MTQLNSFNKSSGSGKNFFGAMLVVALALHAAVLVIPTGANSKSSENSEAAEKKSQVEPSPSPSPKVTPKESDSDGDKTASKPILKKSIPATPRKSLPQLARKTTPSSTPRKTTPKTSKPTPSQTTTTRQKASTASTSRASTSRASTSRASTSTASTSTSKSRVTTQSSSTSTQTQNISSNSTNSNSSTQKKPNPSTPTKPNPSTPTKPSLPPQPTVSTTLNNFSKGFPFYFGSLLTSGGIIKTEFDNQQKPAYIYHTTDELDKVATEFKKELEAKGFTIKEETKESNFQVYRATKDGKDQFIHFVNKDKKTAIFMDDNIYKLDEIENKSPENKPSIVVDFYEAFKKNIRNNSDLQLEKIKTSDIDLLRKNEALKNLSKTTEEVEIEQLLLDRLQVTTSLTKPLDLKQTAETITTELNKGDKPFTFTKVDGYGGDNLALYEVKQGELKIYMILTSIPEIEKVSTQADKVESQPDKLPRTAILFTKKDPRQWIHQFLGM